MAAWGYKTKNGPALWKKDFPVAEGPRQSPISMHSSILNMLQKTSIFSLMLNTSSDITSGSAVPEAFPAIEAKYGDVR